MFSSAGNGRSAHAEDSGQGPSIWGDPQSKAASIDQYSQLLQQGASAAARSSLDSRSSGGLFGGEPRPEVSSSLHEEPEGA